MNAKSDLQNLPGFAKNKEQDVASEAAATSTNANANQAASVAANAVTSAAPTTIVAPVTKADALVASSSQTERIAVVNQVSKQVAGMAVRSDIAQNGVTVEINPPHWGKMTISVKSTDTVGDTRGIEATLTTSSDTVKKTLLQQTGDLHDALQQSGVRLDKLNVVVSTSSSASHDSGGQFSGQSDSSKQQTAQQSFSFSQGSGQGQQPSQFSSDQQNRQAPSAPAWTGSDPIAEDTSLPVQSQGAGSQSQLVDYRI